MEKQKFIFNKQNIMPILLLLAMIILIVVMLIDLLPLLVQVIQNRNDEGKMIAYIDAHGSKGVPLLIGMSTLQVILAFIPSTVVQMLAGLCYGVAGGAIIFLIGSLLGNIIVFSVLRQFGKVLGSFVGKKSDHEKKHSPFSGIMQMKNPTRAAFLLFLIPGMPVSILPYFFVKSSITLSQYLAAVVFAGLPSTLLCTWLGDRISKGDWKMVIILILFAVVLAGGLFFFRNRLFQYIGLNQDKAVEMNS